MQSNVFPKIAEFLAEENFNVNVITAGRQTRHTRSPGIIHCSKDGDGYSVTYWHTGGLNVVYDGDKTKMSENHPKSEALAEKISRRFPGEDERPRVILIVGNAGKKGNEKFLCEVNNALSADYRIDYGDSDDPTVIIQAKNAKTAKGIMEGTKTDILVISGPRQILDDAWNELGMIKPVSKIYRFERGKATRLGVF